MEADFTVCQSLKERACYLSLFLTLLLSLSSQSPLFPALFSWQHWKLVLRWKQYPAVVQDQLQGVFICESEFVYWGKEYVWVQNIMCMHRRVVKILRDSSPKNVIISKPVWHKILTSKQAFHGSHAFMRETWCVICEWITQSDCFNESVNPILNDSFTSQTDFRVTRWLNDQVTMVSSSLERKIVSK